jgi:hypothetical protein
VADYAWVQRDLEGNAPERTTADPSVFMSEKHPAVGATAEIKSVSQPTTEDGSLASALAGGRTDMTAGIRHQLPPPVSGHDAEKEMMRGRGEGGYTAEPLPGHSLQRIESDRPQEIRGEDFKRVEARGRGEGGVPDRDSAL